MQDITDARGTREADIGYLGQFNRWFPAAIAAAIAVGPADAEGLQQGVRGVVGRLETGDPIDRAAVVLLGADGAVYGAGLSDSAGAFRLDAPIAGRYVLRVHRAGYDPTESPIEIPPHAVLEVRVNLRPNPLMLDPITIYGEAPQLREIREFWQRRNQRRGYQFTREDFERLRAHSVVDLLPTIPGYRPQGGSVVRDDARSRSVSLNFRRCAPAVFVDGFASKLGLLEVFGDLPLSHVYGVEVFRVWSDVPGEYASHGKAQCGVILIWTVAMERR